MLSTPLGAHVPDEVVVERPELFGALDHARVADRQRLDLLEGSCVVFEPGLERARCPRGGEPASPSVQDGDDLSRGLRARLRRLGSAREVVAEALEPRDEVRPRDLLPVEQRHARGSLPKEGDKAAALHLAALGFLTGARLFLELRDPAC